MPSKTMALPGKLLVQMSGAPGSGKSTTAKLLAGPTEAIVLDHDLLRSFFLDNDLPSEQSAKLAYRLGWTLAEDLIKQGRSVIMDSTCNFDEVLSQGIALAQKYGWSYRYIECRVQDVDLLDQRLHGRVPLRSQRRGVYESPPDTSLVRSAEESQQLFKRWIERPCRPESGAIIVETTGSPEECLQLVMEQISAS